MIANAAQSKISSHPVNEQCRIKHTAAIFGDAFPLQLEPFVFHFASMLSREYKGGYWEFYALSNGGFYMAPISRCPFHVSCENGYIGTLTAEALGITVCLYAYSHLSFSKDQEFAETCAQQYHWLREYMLDHAGATEILRAID